MMKQLFEWFICYLIRMSQTNDNISELVYWFILCFSSGSSSVD